MKKITFQIPKNFGLIIMQKEKKIIITTNIKILRIKLKKWEKNKSFEKPTKKTKSC